MKLLKITNSEQMAIVENEDYERLSRYNWRHNDRNGKGSIQVTINSGYKIRSYSLASMVMQQPGVLFDHIDNDPFNNLKSNLRRCNYAQNAWNRLKSVKRKSSSKYKGVFFNKNNNNWRACLMIKGQRLDCGSFSSEIDAAHAYNLMASKHHGEFAKLNTIS